METVWELSWRIYLAAPVLVFGIAALFTGVRREVGGLRTPITQPGKNLKTMRGFRVAVLGLALAGVAVAWIWQIPAVLAASLVIGFEETIESSIVIYALKSEEALER